MYHRPTRRPRRSLVLLAVPLWFAAAACGDDADTAAPAATVPDESMADTMSDDSMADESMADTMSDESMSDTMADESMSDTMADESMSDTMSDDSMADESMADESMADTIADESMADLPGYQTLTITDVDGVAFTLHELAGTPVVVEAFATWCPSCRAQLATTNEAAAALGDTAEVLALSVETDLSSADVAAYAADNGFDNIRFAVITPEMLAALVESFGNSIANPPSTPKFVLDPMGHASELTTGAESVDEIVAAVQSMSA